MHIDPTSDRVTGLGWLIRTRVKSSSEPHNVARHEKNNISWHVGSQGIKKLIETETPGARKSLQPVASLEEV